MRPRKTNFFEKLKGSIKNVFNKKDSDKKRSARPVVYSSTGRPRRPRGFISTVKEKAGIALRFVKEKAGAAVKAVMGLKKPILAAICAGIVVVIALPIVLASVLPGQAEEAVYDEPIMLLPSAVPSSTDDISSGDGYAEPIATVTATPEPTPTPEPTLAPGVRSEKVIDLQKRLMELGYMEDDEPTDLYGPLTKSAVATFQQKNDLVVDGYAGDETYAVLMSDDAKTYMVSEGDKGTDIEQLQVRLSELGYTDKTTGYFGTDTTKAVKEFQSRNGLTVDGKVGMITREKLYSEDVRAFSYTFGQEGDEIKKFQNRLKELGYLTTTPDGKYGKDTVTAVKRFQDVNGLIADGYIGPQTKSLLMSKDAQSNGLSIGAKGDDVINVQKRLIKLGYLKGNATGYFGSSTDDAVKAFQKRNGLSVDGKVGRATMNKLMSSSAKSAKSSSGSSSSGGNKGTAGGSTTSSKSGVEKLIAAAESKLGCKYVLGAKGPNKFDCSGLAYWCINQAGVKMGYMTSYAWRSTSKFQRIKNMGDMKRGDIIIYKLGSRRGHVGIYLGGGQMIDASTNAGKVVKRSCTTSYWKNSFYCAYRIF